MICIAHVDRSSAHCPEVITVHHIGHPFKFPLVVAKKSGYVAPVGCYSCQDQILPAVVIVIEHLQEASRAIIITSIAGGDTHQLCTAFRIFREGVFGCTVVPVYMRYDLPVTGNLVGSSGDDQIEIAVVVIINGSGRSPVQGGQGSGLQGKTGTTVIHIQPDVTTALSGDVEGIFITVVVEVSPDESSVDHPIGRKTAT